MEESKHELGEWDALAELLARSQEENRRLRTELASRPYRAPLASQIFCGLALFLSLVVVFASAETRGDLIRAYEATLAEQAGKLASLERNRDFQKSSRMKWKARARNLREENARLQGQIALASAKRMMSEAFEQVRRAMSAVLVPARADMPLDPAHEAFIRMYILRAHPPETLAMLAIMAPGGE